MKLLWTIYFVVAAVMCILMDKHISVIGGCIGLGVLTMVSFGVAFMILEVDIRGLKKTVFRNQQNTYSDISDRGHNYE